MRLKANKMGYSLNQRGLYKDVIRDPSNRMKKLHNGTSQDATNGFRYSSLVLRYPGTIMASETEREIFDILRKISNVVLYVLKTHA